MLAPIRKKCPCANHSRFAYKKLSKALMHRTKLCLEKKLHRLD